MRKETKRAIAAVALLIVAAFSMLPFLTACALTNMVDREYLGILDRVPTQENRKALGMLLLPFAMVGDLVSAPVQAIILIVGGDDTLYKEGSYLLDLNREGGIAKRNAIGPTEQGLIAHAVEYLSKHPSILSSHRPVVLGIDEKGCVVPIDLSENQVRACLDRLEGTEGL